MMTVNENVRMIAHHHKSPSYETLNLAAKKSKDDSKEKEDEKCKPKVLTKQKKTTLFMLAVAYVCTQASYSLLAPFFPNEAAKKDVTPGVIGFIFCSFELIMFLTSFIYGSLMTIVGPKFMYIAGLAVCGCCAILFGLLDRCPSGAPFIALAIITRSLEGLGASAFSTATFAIAGFTFTEYLSTATSVLEACSGIGITIGPPLGGFLYEAGGYGLPFWVIGSIIIATIPLAVYLLPNDVANDKNKKTIASLPLFKSPMVLLCAFNLACGTLSFSFFFPSLAQHVAALGLTPLYTGLIFMISPATYAVFGPLFGWMLDKWNAVLPALLMSNVGTCIGLLLLGPCPLFNIPQSVGQIGGVLVIQGACGGAIILVAMRGLFLGATEMGYEDNMETYGLVSGILTSSLSFGAFLGPLLGGILQQHFGFAWQTSAGAMIFLVSIPLCCVLLCYRKCTVKKVKMCCYPKANPLNDLELYPILKE